MRHALLALFVISACSDVSEIALGTETAAVCGTNSGCGTNGALVAGNDISWIRLDGIPYRDPNEDPNENRHRHSVRFVAFATSLDNMRAGLHEQLDIEGNILRWGSETTGGATVWHEHGELIGTIIRVAIVDERAVEKLYDIMIAEVHYRPADWGIECDDPCPESGTPYWTQVPSGDAETYRFWWNEVGPVENFHNEVCPADVIDTPLWNRAFNAVVFEGEKYDSETLIVSPRDTTRYTAGFNIACFGSLPAKQELARRTGATATATYHTTIDDDRQALAHAWGAQYCGPGTSFTHQGHRLRIRDRHMWLDPNPPLGWTLAEEFFSPIHYEAVWNKDGAVCLDTPRLAVFDANVPVDPQIWHNITDICTLPRCSDQPWFPSQWRDHGDFLTATFGFVLVQPP